MSETLRILLTVFGIGLVIFVHELGHYLAARLCGVRVLTFSLGFGPRLVGWRRKGTLFQVAVVPFGGYCRMAGDEMPEAGSSPRETHRAAPRSAEGGPAPQRLADRAPAALPDAEPARSELLCSKTVGQRFFIYSGGVLMNVVFALAVFPILFHLGIPAVRPVLGPVTPGGPAWRAGLVEGTEVLAVNGSKIFQQDDLFLEVALAGDRVELLVRDPGAEHSRRVEVRPEPSPQEGVRTIGTGTPLKRDAEGRPFLEPAPDSPAARAGLLPGDRLVAVEGEPPGVDLLSVLLRYVSPKKPLTLRVTDGTSERTVRVVPEPSETLAPPRVGIAPVEDVVRGLRPSEHLEGLGLREGDRLITVQGRPILRPGDLGLALLDDPGPLEVVVERDGARLTLQGPGPGPGAVTDLVASIALGRDEGTRVVTFEGEPAARAGMRDGDRIVRIDGTEVERWDDVLELVGRAGREERSVTFTVSRESPEGTMLLDVEARPQASPVPFTGITLLTDDYVFRTEGVGQAVRLGALCSWRLLKNSWLTVERMFQRQIPANSLGGIITISVISYSLAESGWEKLFFFLCMLSINLAFLNLLPIPALDGGHLFFLIVEKLKGSPVSARVWSYSQLVGVILILSLMVYVTYNDFVRWVLGNW